MQAGLRAAALKLPQQATWGSVQNVHRGDRVLPLPGGDGTLGIYNAMQRSEDSSGQTAIVSGSSYIQLVSFDEQGPVAHGLLAFSQSSGPASPHYSDQTELFSRQQWPLLPFTAEQLQANPPVRQLLLSE